MKMGKPHVVPLSDTATAILTALPHRDGLLFPGKRGAPLGSSVLLELVWRLRPGATVHGFRSSFADYAAEVVGAADYVIEQSLAHSVGDATRKAYRRSELIGPRRRLMQAWADHCGSRERGDNVVNLR
jgi:integrase